MKVSLNRELASLIYSHLELKHKLIVRLIARQTYPIKAMKKKVVLIIIDID